MADKGPTVRVEMGHGRGMSYINIRGPRMKEWVQEAKHPEKPKRFELFLISTLQLFHTPSSKNMPCQWINSEGHDPAEHVFRGT